MYCRTRQTFGIYSGFCTMQKHTQPMYSDSCHLPVDCMPAAVVDSFISINSLPVITISATTDACEDDGDVVISSKAFIYNNGKSKNQSKKEEIIVFFDQKKQQLRKKKPKIVSLNNGKHTHVCDSI